MAGTATQTWRLTDIRTWVFLWGLSMWLFITALPRACIQLATYLLDKLENTLLGLVWRYQEENIVRFLHRHQYVQSGVLSVPGDNNKVQTNNHHIVEEIRQALGTLPQKSQLIEAISEMNILVRQQQELPPKTTSDIRKLQCSLDALVSQVQGIEQVLQQQSQQDRRIAIKEGVDGQEVASQLVGLLDGMGAVRDKCEEDKVMALQLAKSLMRLETALTELSQPTLGSSENTSTNDQEDCSSTQSIKSFKVGPSSSNPPQQRQQSQDTLPRKSNEMPVPALVPEVITSTVTTGSARGRPRKLSIGQRIKRHSWFSNRKEIPE